VSPIAESTGIVKSGLSWHEFPYNIERSNSQLNYWFLHIAERSSHSILLHSVGGPPLLPETDNSRTAISSRAPGPSMRAWRDMRFK
jgi:hypothetical protein